MTKIFKVSLSLVLIIGLSVVWSQNPDPLDFIPHHEGDIWEYWVWEAPNKQNIIYSDSLGEDGKYYLETTMFGPMVVDTINLEVYRHRNFIPQGALQLWYNLDAEQGDDWWVYADTINDPFIGKVDTVYQDLVFGQSSTIKKIDYFWVFNSESLWTVTDYLARNFGMIEEDVEFYPYLYLIKGAIIDSVLYGNVTVPIEKKNDTNMHRTIALHQNYPNLFNPKTTIQYELPVSATVELTVYDLLGEQVTTLVDIQQQV